jgi:hypothetical protein
MVKALEAGKLIIGAIAVCTDPTGTAAVALGCDAALQVNSWFSKQPDLVKLANELNNEFKKRLNERQFDKPKDARALLPQMLESVAITGDGLVECGLDADIVFSSMKMRLEKGRIDFRSTEILDAFKALMLPLLRTACNDPRLERALRPQLTRTKLRSDREFHDTQSKTNAKIEELRPTVESIFEIVSKEKEEIQAQTTDRNMSEIGQLLVEIGRSSRELSVDDLVSFLQRLRLQNIPLSSHLSCNGWDTEQ